MHSEKKKITRISFMVPVGQDLHFVHTVSDKITAVLNAEGLKSYYGETSLLGFTAREIGYFGHTQQVKLLGEDEEGDIGLNVLNLFTLLKYKDNTIILWGTRKNMLIPAPKYLHN